MKAKFETETQKPKPSLINQHFIRVALIALLMLGSVAAMAQTTDSFTTAGTTTWTVPAGVFSISVECWGGGGSGGAGINGGGTTAGSGAGGGGGGAYVSTNIVSVTPGTIFSVVVGAGGAAGTTSNPGTDSIFSNSTAIYALAKGGTAGASVNGSTLAGAGGAGGAAASSIGTTKFSGGAGANGVAGANPNGGGGGGSSAGTAANGNPGSTTTAGAAPTGGAAGGAGATSSANGGNASSPGGGGGGAKTASATQRNGGAGGTGQVKITYTVISAPTVTSSAATGISTTGATLNGNVTADGGATVTERGFVFKTSAGATITDNKTVVAGGPLGAFTLTPTLSPNVNYFFKAFATNIAGTTLSSPELSFWTLANTPTSPTVGGPTASSLDVAIGGGDGNSGATVYAILVTNSANYVQANGSLGAGAVYQTAGTWGTKTVTGLTASTTYGFAVVATNGAGVATAFGPTNSVATSAATSPTITLVGGPLSFGNVEVNGTSAEQTFTSSGVNLTADISLTAPANFEISTTSGGGFGSSLNLPQSGGTVSATTIYVRFKPTARGNYSAAVSATSTGANSPSVTVTGAGTNSANSNIIPDGSFTTPQNIAYGSYQEANLTASSLAVAQFVIQDGGGSADLDSVGTILTNISFTVANSANLRRVGIFDGSTELQEVAAGATITFNNLSAPLTAADGSTKTFTLRASFLSAVTDNQQIQFTVNSATVDPAGSSFAAANAGAAPSSVTGNNNKIIVTATKLALSTVPTTVTVNADFSVTVQAQDANNNVDLDNTASVTLSKVTGSGTLANGAAQNLVNGVRTFSTLQYNVGGSFTITASDSPDNLTDATSGNITAGPTALAAGDIAVIGYNTSGSPDNFAILVLKDLGPGTVFYVNDNEVASAGGTSFADLAEGEASFTVKAGQVITNGTVIILPWGAGAVSTTTYDYSSTSTFGLGNNNDEIYIYNAASITDTTPTSFIYGVAIGTSTSARPAGLTTGTTFITPSGAALRYKTTGATYIGSQSALLSAIGNTANNWEASAPSAAGDWTFTLCDAPTPGAIAANPAFPVCAGTSVTLTASATGGSTPYGYQWRSNGIAISGATSFNYTIPAPINGDSYTVVISSACGSSATSAATNVVLNAATAIALQPSSASTCTSGSATFTNFATGTGTLTYQWQLSTDSGATFNNISGATATSYTTNMPSLNASGYQFRSVVTGTCGSVTSSVATLTVTANVAPSVTISANPSLSVCPSTAVTLTANPVNGGTPTYQWYSNGVATVTGATYNLGNPINADQFYVVMTSTDPCRAADTAQSATATVTVNPIPTSTISAPSSVCANSTGNSASVPVSAGGTYGWTISGGTITAGQAANTVTFTAGASGSVTLNCSVTNASGCVSGGAQNTSVTINPLPASTITASSGVLSGSTGNTASVPNAGAGASYGWTIGNGTITAGSGTASITYTAGASGNVTLGCTVTNSSGCYSNASSATVAIVTPFTPGNLVVERIGTGSATLTADATAVFLDEYTTAGVLVQSVAMPTVAGSAPTTYQLTDSGVSTSNGMLTRSTNGLYLVVSGYAANLGTASVASGAGISRSVGLVKTDTTVNTTTAFTDGFVGNNFRSAASTDGTNIWMAGNSSAGSPTTKGMRYTTNGASTTASIDNTVNGRCVAIYGGNLYYNSQTALYKISGTPTTATAPTTITFSGTSPSSMYQFVFLTLPSGDVCYIADENLNAILKYSVSGTTLTYRGQISAAAVRGLTATVSGSTVTLYGTTGGNINSTGIIYSVSDTAANTAPPSTATATPIVDLSTTANPTNQNFRGIAFAPVSLTAYTVTGGTGCGSVTVGLAGSQSGVSYQLKKDGVDTGSPVSGTGSAISFGSQSAAGVYTVVASEPGGIMATMTGNATVNALPSASFNSVTRNAGTDLRVALTNFTGNVAGVGIASLNLTTSGNQTLILDGANLASSTLVLVPAATTNTETFNYTLTNATCSANGTVTITVASSTGQQDASIRTDGGSGIILTFYGILNTDYRIQKATDAGFTQNIEFFGPINTGNSGQIRYTNNIGLNNTAFYRLVFP